MCIVLHVWVGKKKKRLKKKCKKKVVKEACPKTCDKCPKITKEPTNSPTNEPTNKPSSTKKPPNILLILADDVGTGDIPFYWNTSLVDMPNIQRLASMGVTFTNAHSTPLCAPSRYSLLSGNYPHRGALMGGSWGIGAKDYTQKSDSQTDNSYQTKRV